MPSTHSSTKMERQPNEVRQQAAEERRETRSNGEHQVHQRKAPDCIGWRSRVAHDRTPQHQARAAAEGLEKARGNERVNVAGERCRETRGGIERKSDHQGRAPSVAVG